MQRILPKSGFTLLELLAVILIIGILAGVLVSQLGGAEDAAGTVDTRNRLSMLTAILDEYELEFGRHPPSSFTPEQGVSNDGTNVGIEALVVALFSDGYNVGGHDIEDMLDNTDADASARTLGDLKSRNLNEIVDYWENPIAYFARQDYGVDDRAYSPWDSKTGEQVRDLPQALSNPKTGTYYKPTKFQLISAGPDGRFNTRDDITNFKRAKSE